MTSTLEVYQPSTLGVLAESAELTATSLRFRDSFSASDWLNYCGVLFAFAGSANWWIGDALAEGEAMLGESYAQVEEVAERFGIHRDRLRQCQWVAERVPPSIRSTSLSWTHHYRVASLPPDEQLRRLGEAAAEEWTSNDLRRAIAANGASDPGAEFRAGMERVLDRLDALAPIAELAGAIEYLDDARIAVQQALRRAGASIPITSDEEVASMTEPTLEWRLDGDADD